MQYNFFIHHHQLPPACFFRRQFTLFCPASRLVLLLFIPTIGYNYAVFNVTNMCACVYLTQRIESVIEFHMDSNDEILITVTRR